MTILLILILILIYQSSIITLVFNNTIHTPTNTPNHRRCPDPLQVAAKTNQDLLVLVNETSKALELSPLLETLKRELASSHIPTRMAALRCAPHKSVLHRVTSFHCGVPWRGRRCRVGPWPGVACSWIHRHHHSWWAAPPSSSTPLLTEFPRFRWSSSHAVFEKLRRRWINMLLEKAPQQMSAFIGELLPALLTRLSDDADDVVLMSLKVESEWTRDGKTEGRREGLIDGKMERWMDRSRENNRNVDFDRSGSQSGPPEWTDCCRLCFP